MELVFTEDHERDPLHAGTSVPDQSYYEDLEADIREAFRTFDRDEDGFLKASELGHVLEQLGLRLTSDELDDVVRIGDRDQDGRIGYKDFACMMRGQSRQNTIVASRMSGRNTNITPQTDGDCDTNGGYGAPLSRPQTQMTDQNQMQRNSQTASRPGTGS